MAYDRDQSLVRYVLSRDCGMCQCCYGTKYLDVHHIRPLYLGGADHPDNMIALCAACHRWAPEDHALFLQYQREGGISTKIMIGQIVTDLAHKSHQMTIRELYDHVIIHRLQEFQRAWNTYHSDVKPSIRKARQKEADRNDLLHILTSASESWFTVRELHEALPNKSRGQIYTALATLVNSGLVRKKNIERAGYFQIVAD